MQRATETAQAALNEAKAESERLRRSAKERADEEVSPLEEEVVTLRRQHESAESNLGDLRRQLGLVSGDDGSPLLSLDAEQMPSLPLNAESVPDGDATQQLPVIAKQRTGG